MKLSVSLSADDVALLDEFASAAGLRSRSAALQHAIRLLRHTELERDYAAAWEDWASSGGAAAWSGVMGAGLVDAAR